MLNNRRPHQARLDAWLGIAAGTVAAAAGLASGSPGGWAVGGAGSLAGGAIALRRTAEFSQGRRLELAMDSLADTAMLRAADWLMKPQTVAGELQAVPEPGPLPPPDWWPILLGARFIQIVGPQGSGKTTLVHRLLSDRAAAGHQVRVLDPHARYDQWQPWEVMGRGMDWAAIDRAIDGFCGEIKAFYEAIAQGPVPTPEPLTLLTEEMTTWASHVRGSDRLVQACSGDIRKANRFLVMASHGSTLAATGGAKGFAKVLEQAATRLLLDHSPTETGATAGTLYRPGDPNPIRVEIGRWAPSTSPAIAPAPQSATMDPIAQLERAWSMDAIEVPHETIATDALPAEGQAIVNWLRDRGGETVKLRDLQRAGLAPLKGMNSEAILIRLRALSEGGYLKLWNDGVGWRIRSV